MMMIIMKDDAFVSEEQKTVRWDLAQSPLESSARSFFFKICASESLLCLVVPTLFSG